VKLQQSGGNRGRQLRRWAVGSAERRQLALDAPEQRRRVVALRLVRAARQRRGAEARERVGDRVRLHETRPALELARLKVAALKLALAARSLPTMATDPTSIRVGVVGGGQLGQMMALAAHRLGIHLTCLDPAGLASPAGKARTPPSLAAPAVALQRATAMAYARRRYPYRSSSHLSLAPVGTPFPVTTGRCFPRRRAARQ
jgi:hypothetical protein